MQASLPFVFTVASIVILLSSFICLSWAAMWELDSLSLPLPVDNGIPDTAVSPDGKFGYFVFGDTLIRMDLFNFSLDGYYFFIFFFMVKQLIFFFRNLTLTNCSVKSFVTDDRVEYGYFSCFAQK
jgi:hypothetical protein